MPDFESFRSYRRFRKEVRDTNRYVRSAKSNKFLDALATAASDRLGLLEEGQGFWRAQIGCELRDVYQGQGTDAEVVSQEPIPYPEERMKPRRNKAKEGRANPKGIAYLYGAEKKRTAVTEVRPWVGARVTVSVLRTREDLQLVDCSQGGVSIYPYEPPPEKRDEVVWQDIDRAFSRPVSNSDDAAAYAPTQIIADLFKQEGYDGILYESSLADGRNIVLFDIDKAEIERSEVVSISSVEVDFKPAWR